MKKLKKEFENGVVITKDNIHLYYEFMSDEDLKNNARLLHSIFDKRYDDISKILCGIYEFAHMFMSLQNYFIVNDEQKYTCLKVFGIKDTLKPLDEYIAEIKSSEAFLTHLIQKYYDFCEVKEAQEGYYELIDTVSDKLILNGDLSDIMSYINDAHKYVSK